MARAKAEIAQYFAFCSCLHGLTGRKLRNLSFAPDCVSLVDCTSILRFTVMEHPENSEVNKLMAEIAKSEAGDVYARVAGLVR